MREPFFNLEYIPNSRKCCPLFGSGTIAQQHPVVSSGFVGRIRKESKLWIHCVANTVMETP